MSSTSESKDRDQPETVETEKPNPEIVETVKQFKTLGEAQEHYSQTLSPKEMFELDLEGQFD